MKTIVIDSGSTKADIADLSTTRIISAPGINPTTLTGYHMSEELEEALADVGRLCFYGAGVYDDSVTPTLRNWLRLPHTTTIEAHSDLLGACRAVAGNEAGIVSILGTGSNSCVYDGTLVTIAVPSLGYVLGDEGGGTQLGKLILQSYYYETMPSDTRKVLEDMYDMTRSSILEGVYKNSAPNTYLASYAKLLSNIDNTWKKELLRTAFRAFIETRILPYEEHTSLPLYFVGSIAHHYQSHMDAALAEYGLTAAAYLQKPIHQLIKYHMNES